MKKGTLSVHAGSTRERYLGGVNSPIVTSSAIEYLDDTEVRYPRYFNTFNQQVVAAKLCALEGAADGIVTSSGMAAISSIMMGLLHPGEHAVVLEGMYGGTYSLVTTEFRRLGIEFSISSGEPDDIKEKIRPNTRLLFVESPTNPLLSILDLAAIASIARAKDIVCAIDNTFATPILQNPVEHGFDLVMHSGTKYLGGHSDLCCGVVVGPVHLMERIRAHALMHGGSLNAQECYLLERSLKTLELRVLRQSENALQLASALEGSNRVAQVHYPGLAAHPRHDVAERQMKAFGGMLSFRVTDGVDPDAFLRALDWIPCAVSLGGVETMVCQPVATSHQRMQHEERERLGITPQLIRVSVGIENPEDITEEVLGALDSAA
ncbi:MAG: trans-sulfuration enzyme family protein [Lysobacterales bacterium]